MIGNHRKVERPINFNLALSFTIAPGGYSYRFTPGETISFIRCGARLLSRRIKRVFGMYVQITKKRLLVWIVMIAGLRGRRQGNKQQQSSRESSQERLGEWFYTAVLEQFESDKSHSNCRDSPEQRANPG